MNPPPRFLVSPTAFKGTLTPDEAARAIARGVRSHARSVRLLPLADGGDGTLDVLLGARGGRRCVTRVTGPLGKPVRAEWGIFGRTAVIEMARASGLALTKGKNRVMEATSGGTGELIRAALDAGCREILVGVGGTATADGGAGALAALGLRYLDAKGRPLAGDIRSLRKLARVDGAGLDPRLKKTRINVLCDVKNPLLGARGSARTFGPQKGATPSEVREIESSLRHFSRFAFRQKKGQPGAGAAGALAFGLASFVGANLVDGCAFILRSVRWESAARHADVIVTGEGRLDRTSFSGKVAGSIARRRGRARVIAVCGSTTLTAAMLKRGGVTAVETLGSSGLRQPAKAVEAAARRLVNKI